MNESEDQDIKLNKTRRNSVLYYKKKEFKKLFPNIFLEMEQIEENNTDKLESIENEENTIPNSNLISSNNQDNLKNPGVNDFLRRCSTLKEAFEIIDYLYNRNELSNEDYNQLKKELTSEESFKKCIEKWGGFKKKGYYIDKYYNKKT